MRLHWLSIYYVKYLFSLDCTGVTNQTQTIFLEQLFCTAFEYHDWFNTQTHPKDANENEIESKLIFQPLQTGHLSEWIKSTSTQQEQQSSSSSSLPNQPTNRWWVQLQTRKRMAQVQPRKIIMNNRQKYTKITQFQVPSNWASTAAPHTVHWKLPSCYFFAPRARDTLWRSSVLEVFFLREGNHFRPRPIAKQWMGSTLLIFVSWFHSRR